VVYQLFTACLVIGNISLLYAREAQTPPSTVHSLCTQAQEHLSAQNYQAAFNVLQEALSIDPNSIKANFYLAHTFFNTGQHEQALSAYKKTAELLPNNPDLYCNLGICANVMNKTQDAIEFFEKAVTIDPSCIVAHLQLIASWEKMERDSEALNACKRLLIIDPHHREALLSASTICKRMGKFEDAEGYCRTVYNQNSRDIGAIIDLASILTVLEEYEEALELYKDALMIRPESLSLYYNLGFVLKKLGYLSEAIAIYTQVIAQKPDYAMAHFSLGLAQLTLGNFEDGFREYEWRWKAYNEIQPVSLVPRWDGSPLAGKTIYLIAEQGYGDTFHFVRYLKLLKEQGAHVVLAPQYALIPFMKLIPYIDEVLSPRDPMPLCDYQASLMSLPLLCGTTRETVPAPIPYLYPDEGLIETWREYLHKQAPDAFRVGICWHGNSQYNDISLRRAVAQKSCPFALFELLSQVSGVQLYSLQKISGVDEFKTVDSTSFVHIFPDDLDTAHGRFMDTAAIIKNLDLVITIDTSIAHLAAALGIETWNLLPEPADWRWMLEMSETPWYPHMRLFRQTRRGDWHGLMIQVQEALQKKIAEYKE